MLAPIVLFTYNRADHVEKTLDSLSKNDLAKDSEIFIFSDGPKKDKDISRVQQTRALIKNEKWKKLFKTVTIVEAPQNKGLANSIISGVAEIISKYGRVIVIEDDCVSSPDFLSFMNESLDFYEHNEKIWSIGGYTVNLNYPEYYNKDVYFMGRTCSYAWATWLNRWLKVDWEVKNYSTFKYNIPKRLKFNEYGMDRSRMLDEQQLGIKNSWAIRFCYAMFLNNMYTVYPRITKIKNIGYDEGTHIRKKNTKSSERFVVSLPNNRIPYELTDEVKIDPVLKKQYSSYFKRSIIKNMVAYIMNVILRIKR